VLCACLLGCLCVSIKCVSDTRTFIFSFHALTSCRALAERTARREALQTKLATIKQDADTLAQEQRSLFELYTATSTSIASLQPQLHAAVGTQRDVANRKLFSARAVAVEEIARRFAG
jgi:hypothetical protein